VTAVVVSLEYYYADTSTVSAKKTSTSTLFLTFFTIILSPNTKINVTIPYW